MLLTLLHQNLDISQTITIAVNTIVPTVSSLITDYVPSTYYQSPLQINQVPIGSNFTAWNDTSDLENLANGTYVSTQTRLYHIPKIDQRYREVIADQLWCTNYNFSNIGTVLGIELNLQTQRLGRIQDYVISLLYNGEIIGNNYANYFAENSQIYGGPNDMWGTNITSVMVQDSSFGVIIGLGPNKRTPHSDTGYIDAISLKVYHLLI